MVGRFVSVIYGSTLTSDMFGWDGERVVGTRGRSVQQAEAVKCYFLNQRTGEGIRSAIDEFERATELDPEYAEAYSGLADSYSVLAIHAPAPDPRAVGEQALEMAQRAVALAPSPSCPSTCGSPPIFSATTSDTRRYSKRRGLRGEAGPLSNLPAPRLSTRRSPPSTRRGRLQDPQSTRCPA